MRPALLETIARAARIPNVCSTPQECPDRYERYKWARKITPFPQSDLVEFGKAGPLRSRTALWQ